jgi:hypothetical protein
MPLVQYSSARQYSDWLNLLSRSEFPELGGSPSGGGGANLYEGYIYFE